MKCIKVCVTTITALCSFTWLYAADSSDALDYYCNGDGIEFQRSVSIDQGVRVHLDQVSYSYVQNPLPIEPSYEFIQDQLVHVGGVSAECAEFLMTQGDQALSADGVMARVHFAFGSSELTEASRYILDQLLARMKYANKVILEGHTDNVGDKQYNFTLGANRAVAVSNYMQQHPNTPYNLVKVSKGETAPAADNGTEKGRYLNRRVDVR